MPANPMRLRVKPGNTPVPAARPVRMSHSGLVCRPMAGKAAAGRRRQSMKAKAYAPRVTIHRASRTRP